MFDDDDKNVAGTAAVGNINNDTTTTLDDNKNETNSISSSWEVVEDYSIIHRKVSNTFQTRKRRH